MKLNNTGVTDCYLSVGDNKYKLNTILLNDIEVYSSGGGGGLSDPIYLVYNGEINCDVTFTGLNKETDKYYKKVTKASSQGSTSATCIVTIDNTENKYNTVILDIKHRSYANYGSASVKYSLNEETAITLSSASNNDSGSKHDLMVLPLIEGINTIKFSLAATNNSSESTWQAYAELSVFNIIGCKESKEIIDCDLMNELYKNENRVIAGTGMNVGLDQSQKDLVLSAKGSTANQKNCILNISEFISPIVDMTDYTRYIKIKYTSDVAFALYSTKSTTIPPNNSALKVSCATTTDSTVYIPIGKDGLFADGLNNLDINISTNSKTTTIKELKLVNFRKN